MSNFGEFNMGVYVNNFLTGQKPDYPFTYAELEAQAAELLGPELFDYVAGGAGDEITARGNVAAFEHWGIVPRMFGGAAERDLSIELFGRPYPTPLLMAPIGVVGVMHASQHGDLEVAKAAAATSVPMVASTLTQDPMEDIAAELGETAGFYQLYTPNDRELAESFVRRAEAAGYAGIVITLDTWALGWRPRDLPRASMPQLKGECIANYLSDPVFLSRLEKSPAEDLASAILAFAQVFGDPSLSWDDLAWLRGLTDLPLMLKGICHPEDVRRARDGGVNGIYCSNHGGRQASSAPTLEFLPGVVAAAEDMPVIFDSGVRSGVDVVKALALGATAVAIGRPYGYGIAVGGAQGAEHVLRCILAEADLTMGLNGYQSIADLTPDILVRLP